MFLCFQVVLFSSPHRSHLREEHGGQELFCDRVHLCRLNGPARTRDLSLLPVSRFLPRHCAGESGLDRPDSTELSPAHPHVLLPLQSLCDRFILLHYHHPPNADEFCLQEEHHFVCWVHDSALFLLLLCYF